MKKSIIIAPSILSADYSRLGEQVRQVEAAGADLIHVDVMDGRFVPQITIGQPVVKALKRIAKLPLDVHLMIVDPLDHIESFAEAGADLISVHAEACPHLHRALDRIRRLGVKPAVALDPATPLCQLDEVIDMVEMVLLMTVNPGWGGQSYIPASTDRIARLAGMTGDAGLNVKIEVDGGIGPRNIAEAAEAGADVFVAGTAVFGEGGKAGAASLRARIADLRRRAEQGRDRAARRRRA